MRCDTTRRLQKSVARPQIHWVHALDPDSAATWLPRVDSELTVITTDVWALDPKLQGTTRKGEGRRTSQQREERLRTTWRRAGAGMANLMPPPYEAGLVIKD